MSGRSDVRITVVAQAAKCPNGHKVGDEFVVGRTTPAGLCIGAFASLLPYITVLGCGGSFPWAADQKSVTFCCPDPKIHNTFRLERLEDEADG